MSADGFGDSVDIKVLPHPDINLIFYLTPEGKKFVEFIKGSNFENTVSIPDGSKLLGIEDLVEVKE